MRHEPTVISPNQYHPTKPSAPKTTNPDAALALSLMSSAHVQRVADRVPELKKGAYILIGITLFSALQLFITKSVTVSMLGAGADKGIVTWGLLLSWAAEITCAVILLTTKKINLAKWLIIVVGCSVAYFLITAVVVRDFIGIAIGGFMLWRIYAIYESVSALPYDPHKR